MPGFKDFTRGETLEAADVNDYLMLQAVMVFDTETDRGLALSGLLRPGLTTYLKSSDRLEIFNGSGWVGIAEYGSIPAVVVGDEVSKSIYMESKDPRVVRIQQPTLFYSIFSNYADGTWHNRIWR